MSQIALQYEALERTPISEAPFRHVVVPNFVREEDLQTLINLMPEMKSGGSFPPEGLRLHPTVRALTKELQGPRLKKIVAQKFGLDIEDAPSMLTLRGRTREKDGRIHRDSEAKLVTILLYLNPESAAWSAQEGCLRLLNGPHNLEDYEVEVKPAHGTLLIFPNGPKTWHGHRQYVGPRYTIQLNYMATNNKARYELRRHRLSALFKRLSFAR
ncbi:2OG-Fe(II) oxygenase [Asaia bogorensis]|uniref:2OG-Fe(II) oxygenase family protein n=1 Tax=Asaia bogorensis TaxID=91915 RepID=UPI000EFC9E09|nr:2OG-Fe(II) oxygenase [Asaia bogorensis]